MEPMRKKNLCSSAMLVTTALIWGIAFVAQSEGMNYVGGFTFNACRFLIGGVVLIPCIFLLGRLNSQQERLTEGETDAASRGDERRYVLRKRSVHCQLSAAVWDCLYDCGKGWLYYGALYYSGSYFGAVYEKDRGSECVGQCSDSCSRDVPFMH